MHSMVPHAIFFAEKGEWPKGGFVMTAQRRDTNLGYANRICFWHLTEFCLETTRIGLLLMEELLEAKGERKEERVSKLHEDHSSIM